MYSLKYWNKDCISWKEFTMKCERFLAFWSDDCCTEEDFCKQTNIDPMGFLGLSNEELDSTAPQELETIRDKCYQIYDDCYEDEKEDCRENYGWF